MTASAVIYGLPGAGKSSVATVLAGVLAGQHLEMSAYARMIYEESGSDRSTYESFVRNELWDDRDFGRVARRAAKAWLGGPVIVSGPRRTAELDVLTETLSEPTILRVHVDEHVRISRAIYAGATLEMTTRRAAEESAWGLVDRRVPEAVDIDNSATLTEAVWQSIKAMTGAQFPVLREHCADNLEREVRYRLEPSSRITDRLRLAGAVTEENLVDDWYIPTRIKTRTQHDEWLRSGLCAPVRVRTGAKGIRLTLKSPPSIQGIAQELTLRADHTTTSAIISALRSLGLRKVVQLRKVRQRVALLRDGLALCYDTYESGIGCLEIEFGHGRPPDSPGLAEPDGAWRRYFDGVPLEPSKPVPLQAVEESLDREAT